MKRRLKLLKSNETGDMTPGRKICQILRKRYEVLYITKLSKVEVDKYLETLTLPELTHE